MSTFDETTKLVFGDPSSTPAAVTDTASEIPGYYAIWAQATDDTFYAQAAQEARGFLQRVANPTTGLIPVRATFDATPFSGWSDFSAEAYRALPNLVIDRIWGTSERWQDGQIDAILTFFLSQGIGQYASAYSLDGRTAVVPSHLPELILVTGVIASLSNIAERRQFLEAAWNVTVPVGVTRYYPGILYLLSNRILGGRFNLCP